MTDPVEQKEPRAEGVIAAAVEANGLSYGTDHDNAVIVFIDEHAGRKFKAGERVVISLAGEVERLTDANGLRRALYEVGVTAWSCSICGPHKGSSGRWCDAGCGSDYNQMTPLWSFDAIAAALSPLPSERKGP